MSNILLIDLSSIAHAMYHVCANEPDPNAASTKTIERVRALASGQPHVAICLDTPPYFRSQVDPTYKANRQKDNNAVIAEQIARTVDALREDGFPVWGAPGYEADDIIATAVHEHLLAEEGDMLIASADKDLLQLVSDRVSIKSLKDGSLIGPDEVKAKFGVWPHQMVDYLSLVGDISDNIIGAKGIGAKRAAEVLETFGNLEDAYRTIDANELVLTPSVTQSLKDFGARLTTVRDLILLRTDAPIPFEQIFAERVPMTAVFGDEEPMSDEREQPLQTANGPSQQAESQQAEQVPAGPARQEQERDRPKQPPLVSVMPKVDQSAALVAREPSGIPPTEYNLAAAPVEWERQLEPRSMAQAKQVAADLFASRMFSAYGNAPAVLSTILAGRELGFQTMASLRAIHIIEGKPSLSAGAIHALVLASGKAEYFRCSQRSAEKATFVTKRKGDPEAIDLSFTIEEARQAWNGKCNPDGTPDEKSWAGSGWAKNPADMCVARALTKLARLVYPDITHGLYAPEEL